MLLGHALFANWLVRRTAAVLLAFVLAINISVMLLGASGVVLISPFHTWNKARALGLFAAHVVNQIGAPKLPSAEVALRQAGKKYNVPPHVVYAIAKAESDFQPYRVSRTGAMGLMQLMPDTAVDLGIADPFHPVQNAEGGALYLSRLWRKYRGDLHRVAAAYNYGPGRVPRTGTYDVPPETRVYVSRVFRYSKQLPSRNI